MSRLEDFINQNRDAFDEESPSENVWKEVEHVVAKKEAKQVRLNPVYKWTAAAAVLFIAATALFFILRKPADTSIVAVPSVDTAKDIAAIAPDIAPEVNQFAKLIALKQQELKVLAKEQPELYQKFTSDMNQLDSSYSDLKKQLAVAPNKEMLLEAMIQNLQLQLEVLNQQLHIINKVKQKTNSHDKDKNFM